MPARTEFVIAVCCFCGMKDVSECRCSAVGLTWNEMMRRESKSVKTLGFHNSPGRKLLISFNVLPALIVEWRG